MPVAAIVRNVSTTAIDSVESARAALARACETREVKRIRAIATAMATANRGREIAIDAAQIVLEADARIGELTREMEKAPAGDARVGRSPEFPLGTQVTKRETLAEHGLSRKRAAECERIASLADSGDLQKYADACRKAKTQPSVRQAVKLAKIESPEERSAAIRQIAEPQKAKRPPRESTSWHSESAIMEVDEAVQKTLDGWQDESIKPLIRALKMWVQRLETREERSSIEIEADGQEQEGIDNV